MICRRKGWVLYGAARPSASRRSASSHAFAAMRLSALLRPLGTLGQRTERRIASLTMESSRA